MSPKWFEALWLEAFCKNDSYNNLILYCTLVFLLFFPDLSSFALFKMALNVSVEMRVETWIFIGDSLAVEKLEKLFKISWDTIWVYMSDFTFHTWDKCNIFAWGHCCRLNVVFPYLDSNPYLLVFLSGPLKTLLRHLLQCDSHRDPVRSGNRRT